MSAEAKSLVAGTMSRSRTGVFIAALSTETLPSRISCTCRVRSSGVIPRLVEALP